MSAWSDWKSGAITESDYAFECQKEALQDEYDWSDNEKSCGNCEYCNWGRQDKPCCYCRDHSEFVECEQEDDAIIIIRD